MRQADTGAGITMGLAADLTGLNSVNVGDTRITSDGVRIANGPSVTSAGIDAGGKAITNVADGRNDGDAVNMGQLNAVATTANAGWNIGNGEGLVGKVAPGKQVDFVAGNATTQVAVTQDAEGATTVAVSAAPGALQYSTTSTASGGNAVSDQFVPTNSVTLVGADGGTTGGVTLNNVAAGTIATDSKQAVTGGQLYEGGTSFASVLGGSTTYNAASNTITGGITVDGVTYSTVNEAINAVNTAASAAASGSGGGTSLQVNGVDVKTGADGKVDVVDGRNTRIVSMKDSQIQIDMVDNPTFSGQVAANGGLKVSGDLTLAKGTKVDMGGNVIHNVADGEVSEDSKQAVNGGQLFKMQQGIGSLASRVEEVNQNASAGTASAMAAAGLPQAYLPGKSMAAMAGANYRGESAIAIGVSTITDSGKWVFKGSVNSNTQGHLGATVGVGLQW